MNSIITKDDLIFVSDLSLRIYMNKSFVTNGTVAENERFKRVKQKLKHIADNFCKLYNSDYGPFETAISTGNPLSMQGKLRRPWSGIFKGNTNKQYAAQVSFVINPIKGCLDVGFYFGRAAARHLSKEQQIKHLSQLKTISSLLSTEIENDIYLNSIYNSLFDYGFQAFNDKKKITPDEWLENIKATPHLSEIVYSIFPSSDGLIEPSVIDLYVSMIIALMNVVPESINNTLTRTKRVYKPLTAEQRAKQAERRTLIGEKGEVFVYNYEKNKLINEGIIDDRYPDHVAKKSMDYGFDILSCEKYNNEIYIEVKSTTRLKSDPASSSFYMSVREYDYFKSCKSQYKLYRVYDIEGNPEIVIIDMESIEVVPNIYYATIKG